MTVSCAGLLVNQAGVQRPARGSLKRGSDLYLLVFSYLLTAFVLSCHFPGWGRLPGIYYMGGGLA